MDPFDRLDRIRRYRRYILLSQTYRRRLVDRSNPLEYLQDEAFERRFRFTKRMVNFILLSVSRDITESVRTHGFPPIYKLLIALHFYATGTFQLVVGDTVSVSQQSCSRVIREVSLALAKKRREFIRFPTEEQVADVRKKFCEVAGFPHVSGAIGCTHIKIECPRGQNSDVAELYRNREGYFSMKVQAVCNPNLQFTSIVVRWYGSAQNARIFDNSVLKLRLEKNIVPGILLGDARYACMPCLLTPFAYPASQEEKKYNSAHTKTRNLIIRTFGIWKRLFPCLTHSLRHHNLKTLYDVILACAVLYNIARLFQEPLLNQYDLQDYGCDDDDDYSFEDDNYSHEDDDCSYYDDDDDDYDSSLRGFVQGIATRHQIMVENFTA